MSALVTFIECLPALISLFKAVRAAAIAAETERRTSEDIKTIHQAFINKDADKLNALFK